MPQDDSKANIALVLPKIPSASDLFDELMIKIEPELTGAQIEGLKAKYKNESPAQAQARAARYESAFALYDQALEAYVAKLNEQIKRAGRIAAQSLENKVRKTENQELSNIESAISQS